MLLHLHLSHSQWPLTCHRHSKPLPPFDFVFSFSYAIAKLQPCPLRDYSPNASLVGPFFSLLALFLVKLSWQALMILTHAQTTLTCISLLCYIRHLITIMSKLVNWIVVILIVKHKSVCFNVFSKKKNNPCPAQMYSLLWNRPIWQNSLDSQWLRLGWTSPTYPGCTARGFFLMPAAGC